MFWLMLCLLSVFEVLGLYGEVVDFDVCWFVMSGYGVLVCWRF